MSSCLMPCGGYHAISHGDGPLLSPDPDAIFRFQIQLVARRDVECFVPSVNIANCIASIFTWRMRIGFDLPAQHRLALELAPSLTECYEEPLFASKPVCHDIGLTFE